jgi:hypothetical protein
MSGYVTDKLREDMHSQLVGSFSRVNISHQDIELMAQHHETDLSSTIIQHGAHKKGVREQSHLSSQKNGGFETSKKDNHSSSLAYAVARQNMNAMQNMVNDDNHAAKISEMGKSINMDFTESLSKIMHHAQHEISGHEVEVITAVAASDVNDSMKYYLNDGNDGVAHALDMAPRNPDGSFMNAEEIKAHDAATLSCSRAGAGEIQSVYTDGAALNEYYAKLADPDIRQTLTAIDVPLKILDELRADRMQTMFDDTYDQRMEAMDKIAEKHGFTAQDGKSAQDVFEEARMSGEHDIGEMNNILDEMMDVNTQFENKFNDDFDANLESHAQGALDKQLIEINNNGGVFIPPPQVNKTELDAFQQKLDDYSTKNTPLPNAAPVTTAALESNAIITQSGDMNIGEAPAQTAPIPERAPPQISPNDYSI